MENQEKMDSLNSLISQIEILKAESGPKANDFVKWVREVKQFIEKAFGAEHPQLRAFKKIDYYPKQFDILSSESSFKKAWMDGLMVAKGILEGLRVDISGNEVSGNIPVQQEVKKEEPKEVKQEEPVKKAEPQPEKIEDIVEIETIEIKDPAPAAKNKKEEKTAEKKDIVSPAKGQKVLLVNINDAKLNEDIFKFIKKMGYEPVVVDQNIGGDEFDSDSLSSSMYGNPVYAIIHWKGEMDCNNKKFPSPYIIFSTGYYVAKLTSKKVLIITYEDINWLDDNYNGLNFLGIDNIQELMELKLAREMDSAGLNIDFNFLKKK